MDGREAREIEGNEALARELSAKRLTREGLKRDLDRFDRKVSAGPPPPAVDDDHADGWRLRWWWLR